MAFLLAPYNEAMRLGMGFNSYTQKLCVNDVVRKSGGIKATGADLRSMNLIQANGQGVARKITQDELKDKIQSSQGEGIIQSKIDGSSQKDARQVVSWEAGFVDTISEVTHKLNISPALIINLDALSGSGSTGFEASLDASAFGNEDLKYDLTIKVINQRLNAPDVTEFHPIPNIPEDRFVDVYGDCFISGFIEGGLFHALVAREVESCDDGTTDGSSRLASAKEAFGAEFAGQNKVEGEATEEQKCTQFMVNWTGGGDIQPKAFNGWTIPNLLQAAAEFPAKVASCPQKTYAVLTKYTSLRSFHERTIKMSLLNYEDAGIYTSSLLDAYVNYKAISREIQNMIVDINRGDFTDLKDGDRKLEPWLLEHRNRIKDNYDSRMARFREAQQKAIAYPRAHVDVVLEEPMPPNDLSVYKPDPSDLEKARQDCRFEMTKILREVKEITHNPQVATDPYRNWRYLNPSIFRRLLPQPGRKQAQGKAKIEQKAQDTKDLAKRLEEAQAEVARLQAEETSRIAKLPKPGLKWGWSTTALPGTESFGFEPTSKSRIAIASRAPEHVECWWIAKDGSVHGAYRWNNEPWNHYPLMGSPGSAAPRGGICAVSTGPDGQLFVFWIGPNGSIESSTYKDNNWTHSTLQPANSALLEGPITVISRQSPTLCEVWWIGPDLSVRGFRYSPESAETHLYPPRSKHPASAGSGLFAVDQGPRASRTFWVTEKGSLVCSVNRDLSVDDPEIQVAVADTQVPTCSRIVGISKGETGAQVFFTSMHGAVHFAVSSNLSNEWHVFTNSPIGSMTPGADLRVVESPPGRWNVAWAAPDGSIQGRTGIHSCQEWPISTAGFVPPETPLALISREKYLHLIYAPDTGGLAVASMQI